MLSAKIPLNTPIMAPLNFFFHLNASKFWTGCSLHLCRSLDVLVHHNSKLLERDLTISILVNLLDNAVDDGLVQGLSEREDSLDLVSRDGTTSVLVEHLESALKLVG